MCTLQLTSIVTHNVSIGERRAQLRSPALQGYIRNTHDRAAQGAIATAASRYEDKNGRQPASRDRKNSF